MSWFRVDDNLHAHRKARRAGAEAMGLWVMCGSYASSQAADGSGAMYHDEVETIALTLGLKGWRKALDRLVEVGLWERTEDGIVFHDWAAYREGGDAELSRRRAKDAKRKREKYSPRKQSEPSPDFSAETPRRPLENTPHPPVPTRPDPTNPEETPVAPAGVQSAEISGPPRVDDPAGMLSGRWAMGIRSVTGMPVSRAMAGDIRALHAAAEAHAPGLRGEALLAWAEAAGADFARSCDPKFGGFNARRFATWLDSGKPKDGPKRSANGRILQTDDVDESIPQ